MFESFRQSCVAAGRVLSVHPSPAQTLNLLRYTWCRWAGRLRPRAGYSPPTFGVYVTVRCNLDCPFCYNRRARTEAGQADLTLEQLHSLLEHPQLRRAVRVALMGGEPLLHPQLPEIVDTIHRSRKLVYVTTNALMIEQRLDDLARSTPDTLQVSLYDGHVDAQIAAVQRLVAWPVRTQLVLSRIVTAEEASWQSMHDVMRMARDVGVRHVMFRTYRPLDDNDVDLCCFEDNDALRAFLADFAQQYAREFRLILPTLIPRNTHGRCCLAPHAAPYIDITGGVSPCCEITPPVEGFPTVTDDDFWNSEALQHFRENFASGFPVHPSCRYCCASVAGAGRESFV